MIELMEQYSLVDEEQDILNLQNIIEGCSEIFQNQDIEYCYLFVSYAKGKALEEYDAYLLVSTSVTKL